MDVCRIGHSQEILYLAIKLAKSFENTFLSLPPILASVGNFPNLLVSLQEKLSGSDHAAARRQICSDVPTQAKLSGLPLCSKPIWQGVCILMQI
jgi:hypothetical protein